MGERKEREADPTGREMRPSPRGNPEPPPFGIYLGILAGPLATCHPITNSICIHPIRSAMNGPFQAYQDENSLLLGQPTGENLKPLPGFGGAKRALSGSRRALGNITNNNGGMQSAKQAVSREVLGDRTRDDTSSRGPTTTSTSGRKTWTYETACVDELMRGGVECPAGMGWDEQLAAREMDLMHAGMVDAAGHEAALRARAVSLLKSVQGADETRRREAIDTVVHDCWEGSEFFEGMRDELEAPASPTRAPCVLEELEDVLP